MKTRTIVFLVFAVILLAGLFILAKSHKTTSTPAGVQVNSIFKTFEYRVMDGQVVLGGDTMSVTEGDKVIIRVTTNVADELHLHGYNQELELMPNQMGEISFVADKTGRFDLELHHSDLALGSLEVFPK